MPNRYFRNVFPDNTNLNYSYYVIWRNKAISLTKWIMKNASSSSSNDLYTGTTGIAYMFYRLATSNTYDTRMSTSYLNKAVEVLNLKEYKFNEKKSSQFICGDAGINAVYAAIYHQIGDEKTSEIYLENFKKGLTICKPIDFHMAGGDEYFVGRAGYLFGVLWLEKVFAKKIIADQDIVELCSTIVESGRRYSKQKKSMFPLMYSYYNKEYLGAAHGLCTILQVLISFPQFIHKEPQAKQDIKTCIDMLISLQTANGNFPCTMNEIGPKQRSEQDELVHWCHGAPGN
ncbi:Hypothetical protein CINCED_3A019936 [Cinara cedri]|uniref:Uncharacterized protein n=1 Tax=Cinara cedri TaxID=506608 RepID=A0A5E4MSH7_9HEMI|nr:Hypothetical protein CINCED_3A019936 [Cinara cedri]